MLINLDIHEMWYLLERCLHGSHLRSDTIERFVNEFYDKFEEHERMRIFEWAVRLGYAWNHNKERCFEPSSACCCHDIEFMKRYHPLNQYNVITSYKRKTAKFRAFKMNGNCYIRSNTIIAPKYIIKIEHIDLSEQWEQYKQPNIDYDKNILE